MFRCASSARWNVRPSAPSSGPEARRACRRDEFGNALPHQGRQDRSVLGFERRWVIGQRRPEASTVPPSWHGWLHHTVDVPPTEEKVTPRPWWKPHRPNLTGTPAAHRPTGSILAQGRRPKATGDYKAWTPEG